MKGAPKAQKAPKKDKKAKKVRSKPHYALLLLPDCGPGTADRHTRCCSHNFVPNRCADPDRLCRSLVPIRCAVRKAG